MNTRNFFTKLSIAIALVAIASTLTIWQTRRVSAGQQVFDPAVFGIVIINSSQAARLNVVCSQHGVNGAPPDPCRGTLMFHDGEGNDLQSQHYALLPGQSMSLEQDFSPTTVDSIHMGINPCIIPAPTNRGRAIPSVEVFDTTSGKTELYINPIPRLSDIDDGQGGRPQPVTTNGQ